MMEFLRVMLTQWDNTHDQMNFRNDKELIQFFKNEYKQDARTAYEYWRCNKKIMPY